MLDACEISRVINAAWRFELPACWALVSFGELLMLFGGLLPLYPGPCDMSESYYCCLVGVVPC